MNEERLYTWRNRWFAISVASVVAIGSAAALIGFVWLPSRQQDFTINGIWESICRAAGVPSTWASGAPEASGRSTSVVMVPSLTRKGTAIEIGRGATLALQCTMCHGARGMSEASSPNLAGHSSEVIYKQLRDYRDGSRRSAVMQALAAGLSDRDIQDLAAYYSYLPRPALPEMPRGGTVPALVRVGDPMRNIAPCASCHGGIEQKAGSPWLEGMPAAYVQTQLRAFANGERRNDALGQMRNVARQLTAAEIAQIASYYASKREAEDLKPTVP